MCIFDHSSYSPVILWFDPKLIATQTISTVSSTKKHALQHIKSSGKSQWGESDLSHDLFGHFWQISRIFCAISFLHHPNYSNLVSDDWSDYKEQGDAYLVSIAQVA